MSFSNKVTIVTGGALGIGGGIARKFSEKGSKIVIADIEEGPLQAAVSKLQKTGVSTIGVKCDVSLGEDVEKLAHQTLEHFGAINIVCNNAGVAPSGVIWEHSTKDWEWAMGPNVWGVIHGIRVFTPIMLKQKEEGHIVNTASVAGLMSFNGMGLYCMTKHAVVTMTECLHHDLTKASEHVRCSVLCPAYVPTDIANSERNRPDNLREERTKSDDEIKMEENLKKAVASGKISADQVADQVLQSIREKHFYILTHPKIKPAIETRFQDILLERPPVDTSQR